MARMRAIMTGYHSTYYYTSVSSSRLSCHLVMEQSIEADCDYPTYVLVGLLACWSQGTGRPVLRSGTVQSHSQSPARLGIGINHQHPTPTAATGMQIHQLAVRWMPYHNVPAAFQADSNGPVWFVRPQSPAPSISRSKFVTIMCISCVSQFPMWFCVCEKKRARVPLGLAANQRRVRCQAHNAAAYIARGLTLLLTPPAQGPLVALIDPWARPSIPRTHRRHGCLHAPPSMECFLNARSYRGVA
ncbi:hypothetical protein F4780DRAFT_590794 [Xylariomycetidae sp. FL0641]|nr:hypothetical protein F4780DRAFT_590794 [Xylariomycetidae sp. FL0641]